VVTARQRLRAFRTADHDADAALRANAEAMRHLLTGCAAACGAG
jgi:hypothetical protein